MPPPSFDQHLGLGEAVEDLTIEQFVAERPVDSQAHDLFQGLGDGTWSRVPGPGPGIRALP